MDEAPQLQPAPQPTPPDGFDAESPFDLGDIYKVELDTFSGPLDLLLYLIKRTEVEITDIAVSRITEQ